MTNEQLREEFYDYAGFDYNSDSEGQDMANRAIKDSADWWLSKLQEAVKEAVGEIGAKLLAKHSPQVVLDAYFDAANEVIEQHDTDN